MDNIVNGYKRTFLRAMDENRMHQFAPLHVECLIYQILGMRAYAAMQIHFAGEVSEKHAIRDAAGETCRLLIGRCLLENVTPEPPTGA